MRTSRSVFSAHAFILSIFLLQITLVLVFNSLDMSGLPLYVPALMSQLITLMLPIILFIVFTKAPIKRVIPCKPLGPVNIILIFLFSIFVQPVMSFFSALSMLVFENDVVDYLGSINSLDITMALLIIAVAPAVCEELAMRGVVMFGYRNMPFHKVVLMNGLLFGLLHLSGQQFLYAFFLGAAFAVLVHFTGSIFSSMLSHFIINGSQLLLARMYSLSYTDEALSTVLSIQDKIALIGSSFVQAVFMLPILYLLFRGLRRANPRDAEVASAPADITTTIEGSKLLYIGDFFNKKIIDWALILIIVIYSLIVVAVPLVAQ